MESWLKMGRLTSGKSVSDSSLDPEPPAVCTENISENVPGSSSLLNTLTIHSPIKELQLRRKLLQKRENTTNPTYPLDVFL
ncbi:hypothetical protein EVAR_80203_1 [Eumeta japonica]|uniref:Uncharacterized protein n=1 Tax=Eumeta variegata TaxID=151549 RepID=A0A4C1UBT5_EUMVA|nr:hypothetical protein EVAR_80203_1 [Eumeta japonica]